MQLRQNNPFFSPSDLITFMESPFASYMERCLIEDKSLSSLIDPEDEMLKALQQKGYDHEEAFLEKLRSEGKEVVFIERASPEAMQKRTRAAMKSGADVVAQAYLELDNFGGLADFLIKVPGKSKLGNFHYEVWDTKLSKKMKPYFAIQLCCYAEMLEQEQGIPCERVAIVLGDNERVSLRVRNYAAYYASLKASFLDFQKDWSADKIPDPAESPSFDRWSEYADKILAERRHLSLVANITRTQIKRLEGAGIVTIDDLAKTDLKAVQKINRDTFNRLKAQAKIQIESEGEEKPKFKIHPHKEGRAIGLALLPPPSHNDIFFDIEGYPLVDGNLEYLWGATYFDADGSRTFRDFWAHDDIQEQQAFTDFIDWAYGVWRKDPTMHIYHYASYEISAIRRLMGRYGTREHEVDTLLRNEVFVDLYKVVRHGVLIGEPSYSIKNVERLYRDKRDTDVATGGDSVVVYGEWIASPDGDTWETSEVLKSIRDYNIDDCNSTQELADWLRERQADSEIAYIDPKSSEEAPKIEEEETHITLLRDRLLEMSEEEADEAKQSVLRNLAWLLEFHRRENKPMWWRYFSRLGLTALDLYDDMDCLVDVQRTKSEPFLPSKRARNYVFEYEFDTNQPFRGQANRFHVLEDSEIKVTTYDYDPDEGLIRFQSKFEPLDRMSLIPDEYLNPYPIPDAIFDVIEDILERDFSPSAIVDFLFRSKPRFVDGAREPIVNPALTGYDVVKEVISAVNDLDGSYLCIQGPPGAGKTYTASHVISDLLDKQCRVGISSNSHKAITNLMENVADVLEDEGKDGLLIKVGGDAEDPIFNRGNVVFRKDANKIGNELNSPSLCIGGTAWFFCNDRLVVNQEEDKLDYLFIDEAGQVSVANLVGMSRCAKNIVLMGDQMQLAQPIQGSHPNESGKSTLEYLLQGEATISADLGVFLPQTYRMHPDVCHLVSEQVYDGRLHSAKKTEEYVIDLPAKILPKNAGIHFLPVEHEGNSQGSEEEVEAIKKLAKQLIGQSLWDERKITWDDMLFVAPYNHQVNLLREALPSDAKIGSVDKFQGQEAPVVFVSMCTSHASESPRGLDFLFSKNRLNVAISRAQSIAIVVGSPRLAITPVNNLHQMELVNFYSSIVKHGEQ